MNDNSLEIQESSIILVYHLLLLHIDSKEHLISFKFS